MRFGFTAPLWEWSARDNWSFVTLPEQMSDQIAEIQHAARGFGSVRVRVTVGGTTWMTSIFPDTTQGSYILPMKKAVRKAEDMADGADVAVTLEVLDV